MASFLEEQMTEAKTLLTAVNAALLAFAQDGARHQVTVDSGQTKVSYSRSDIESLNRVRTMLLSQIHDLEVATGVVPSGTYGRHA